MPEPRPAKYRPPQPMGALIGVAMLRQVPVVARAVRVPVTARAAARTAPAASAVMRLDMEAPPGTVRCGQPTGRGAGSRGLPAVAGYRLTGVAEPVSSS